MLPIEQPASAAEIERIDINLDRCKNRTYSLVLLVELSLIHISEPTRPY